MQEKLEREELGGKIHTMESDVSYRCIGEDFDEGVVACGFMRKRTRGRSQIDFQIGYYSGFFLLGGSGLYVMGDGREFPIRAGDFVQRLPGEMHSTYVEPDGEWLEFFVSFGRERYQVMKKLGLLPETRVNRCPVEDMLEDCAVHLGRLGTWHIARPAGNAAPRTVATRTSPSRAGNGAKKRAYGEGGGAGSWAYGEPF